MAEIEMLEKILHGLAIPLHAAERKIEKLEPTLRWPQLRQLFFITLLFAVYGILGTLLVEVISHYAHPPEYVHLLIPVLCTCLVLSIACTHLRVEYRKDVKELRDDLTRARWAYRAVRGSASKATEAFIDLIGPGLDRAIDGRPISTILAALQPGNSELVARFDDLGQRTLKTLQIMNGFSHLTDVQRATLARLMRPEILEQSWGPLLMTFALHLQLDPWNDHTGDPHYVFIRNYEELSIRNRNNQAVERAFRTRLSKDLTAILGLVNGKLLSVMYNDLDSWGEPQYYRANSELLERKKKATVLKRMFVYKSTWLDNNHLCSCLAAAAQWHKDNPEYECRFVLATDVKEEGGIIRDAADAQPVIEIEHDGFLASCLINDTQILMYQEVLGDSIPRRQGLIGDLRSAGGPNRYFYICDATLDTVQTYTDKFETLWNRTSGVPSCKPDGFLQSIHGRRAVWENSDPMMLARSSSVTNHHAEVEHEPEGTTKPRRKSVVSTSSSSRGSDDDRIPDTIIDFSQLVPDTVEVENGVERDSESQRDSPTSSELP